MKKDLVCIVCPAGCRMTCEKSDDSQAVHVVGNKCPRGLAYAQEELVAPKRQLTSTVKIEGGYVKRLPVRSTNPILIKNIQNCMSVINNVAVKAPVKMGTVIVKNICDTGVDIVASRDM